MKMRPNENTRQRHSIRGLVVEHTDHTTGRWFWKQIHPSLKVSFPEEEHRKLREVLRGVHECAHYDHNWVEIGFRDVAERDQYRIGEVVDVQFSTSNQIEEFFLGADLFRWDGVKKSYSDPVGPIRLPEGDGIIEY
jgi:hypothetical protein